MLRREIRYEAWAPAAPDNGFADDKNGDGITNGLAFLLGASDANAAVTLPTPTENAGGLTLSFDMLNATSRGTASLKIQWSDDLGATDLWTDNEEIVSDASGTPATVTYLVTPGDPTNAVTATIPAGEANGNGRLFGRLEAVE